MRSLSSFVLLIPVLVIAQSDPESDTTRTYPFDPVTVTATRAEVARNSVSSTVTVIPHSSIALHQERSLLSLISQQVPGVFITERGLLGFGANTGAGQLSIRGVGGNPNAQVLMLVDGRPQYMGLFGHPLTDSYLATETERVEVLRGPASLLYGSNAMGGVINIITGSSHRSGWNGSASVSRGSFNTSSANGRAGYHGEAWHATASASYQHTDGHRPNSEFTIQSGFVQAGAELSERFRMTADGGITKFRTSDPGTISAPFTDHWVDILRGYVGFSLDNRFAGSEGSIRFVHNYGDHAIYDGFRSTDDMTTLSIYQTLQFFPGNSFTLGADYKRYGGNVSAGLGSKLGDFHVQEYAAYMHARQDVLSGIIVDGGLRLDHNSVFGDEIIPQIGISAKLTDATTIRSSAAKGFRSPAVFQFYLFVPSNTDLKPERSTNYELGVQQSFGSGASIELVGFLTEGTDLIQFTAPPPKFKNVGTFLYRGLEATWTILPLDGTEIHGSYALFSKAENVASVPKHKVYLAWTQTWNMFLLDATIQHVNGLSGFSGSQLKPLADYTILGLKARYHMLPYGTLSFNIDNALDATYETIYGYPMPGRVLSVGIEVGL